MIEMTVSELLACVPLRCPLPEGVGGIPVAGLDYDSRRVRPGFLFFAFPGQRVDGRSYARQAIERGAVAVVSELPPPEAFDGPWIQVEHGRRALALAARNFHARPDERVALHGVTGTNGKTTITYLIDSLLQRGGHRTALIGTVEYRVAGRVIPALNTTPESLEIYRLLGELEQQGGAHATMEVSSHGLALGRVYGFQFFSAVFTQLTRDHQDFHSSMEDYFSAKRLLFHGAGAPPPRFAVLNADDPWARRIQPPPQTTVLWYGLGEGDSERYRAEDVRMGFDGLRFQIVQGGRRIPIHSPLVGRFNVYNLLAACAVARLCGLDWDRIQAAVSQCTGAPGRFERIEEGQPFLVIVDYAHTDDALRNLIAAARDLSPRRVITLFGCGGDRDRTKRPLMGMAAAEGSDFVVLTSDNPRGEDPLAIINDALVGLRRRDTPHLVEPDRERAIRRAVQEAAAGDIVLIAGKGHETYQEVKGNRIPFDDRQAARGVLRGFGYGRADNDARS